MSNITTPEKLISDMKRDIDSIINWMVDLKVRELIEEKKRALQKNQMLKRVLEGKEN